MTSFECPDCGDEHDIWEMQIGYDKPDAYFTVAPEERVARCTMTDDLADVDHKAFFIRCILDIPVVGEQHPFGWGVWAKVAQGDFHRYRSLCNGDDQRGEPPFPGTIANQLPGYPQTVGVPVSVQPGDDDSRPALTVVDATHPLGMEQRDGIHAERVLEMLSPWLHSESPIRSRKPYFATLEKNGWTLLDAEECLATWDNLNWLPPVEQRNALVVGEIAKLLFEITASSDHGEPEQHIERMWAEITERMELDGVPAYRGVLTNEPNVAGLARPGMEVWWRAAHVIDIVDLEQKRASEGRDVVQCRGHGPSYPTYVCQHLPSGHGLGFHQSAGDGQARPDAWCDACNEVLEAEGEWNDRAAAFADITLLCTACYDIVGERNRKG